MLELYYNFFNKFFDVNKFEELEMDTDSLCLTLAEEDLDDCVLPRKRAEWTEKRSKDCRDDFRADAKKNNFFPRTCCSKHKKHDKREPRLFKEELRCIEILCLCSKTYCCYDSKNQKYKWSVLNEAVKLKSTNRGFKTINHAVATYEQTKKGLSYFYPEREVECDGIHTKSLNL